MTRPQRTPAAYLLPIGAWVTILGVLLFPVLSLYLDLRNTTDETAFIRERVEQRQLQGVVDPNTADYVEKPDWLFLDTPQDAAERLRSAILQSINRAGFQLEELGQPEQSQLSSNVLEVSVRYRASGAYSGWLDWKEGLLASEPNIRVVNIELRATGLTRFDDRLEAEGTYAVYVLSQETPG